VDAPGGFGAADQSPLGDGMREFAAEFFGGGLAGKGIDQRVFDGRYPPSQPLAALQQRQLLWSGQRIAVEPGHCVERGVQRIKRRRSPPDQQPQPKSYRQTNQGTETQVAQVI
jgi:hypothetical protein